ncbi:MAG: alanine racemase [Thermoleophilia bacterium]|nr:alanine racemase [Thermoleophilia bacterium]
MNRALATVDLECVRHNVGALRQRLATRCGLMAVVKADGYGHGAGPVARASLDAGATALGVATVGEASELRQLGFECPIIILGPLTGEEIGAAIDADAEITIWTLPFLKNIIGVAHSSDARIRCHIKVDTGMRRLGLYPRKLVEFLDMVEPAPEIVLAGVMTHFATADEEDDDFFYFQLHAFEDVTQMVLTTGLTPVFHAANSAATLRYRESHFGMVRCGIAIYGLSPFQGDAAADGLRPALSLTSYLADIKEIAEGDSVGYGGTWTAPRRTHVGIVPIGYGDGFNRRLSNLGSVLVGGEKYPVIGRVSMDQITVDLGPSPKADAGSEAVLIGRQGDAIITTEEMATALGTINYEVTCNLSSRVERRYTG